MKLSISAIHLLLIGACTVFAAAPILKPGDVTIGNNLQTYATVGLSAAAASDLEVMLTSSDPARLLLSKRPDAPGSSSITITVKRGFRESPEFWLQALAGSGEVTYNASAKDVESGVGRVKLTPSGITLIAPFGSTSINTTPRAWPSKLTLRAARLDSDLKIVESQYVRGGFALEFKVTSSDPAVGSVIPSALKINAASDTTTAEFRPSGLGTTSLVVAGPAGLESPAGMKAVGVTVRTPKMSITEEAVIGENLQFQGTLNLGEPAPPGGLTVTLTSEDPEKLLLARKATDRGERRITIEMPAGAGTATYFLQAFRSAGKASHTATAPGFVTRVGTVNLAPSGVILSSTTHGPPDEAELFRPESAGGPRNSIFAPLAAGKPTQLILYTAYLDPMTKRSADITVQQLRGGMSVPVTLSNSNPQVGSVASVVTINGGSEKTVMDFKPLTSGKAVISVAAPRGFTAPSNSTELVAIVHE